MASYDQRSGSNDRGLVASGTVYASVLAATTANAAVEGTGDDFSSAEFFNPTYFVRRSAMEFDLSTIPSGSTISSGTLTITFNGSTSDTNNFSVNIFHFTRGSAGGGAFVANDFDEATGTAACATPKDITSLTGAQSFTLNAAALTYLESKAEGYAQFSARLSGDYGPSTPTGGNLLDGFRGHNATESNRPRLQLTYTAPTTTTTTSTSTSTSTSSSTSSSTSTSSSSTSSNTTSTSTSTSTSSSTSTSTSTSSTTTQEPAFIPTEDISLIKGNIVNDTPPMGDIYL